jgi:arylsulfatase A-like enzyme
VPTVEPNTVRGIRSALGHAAIHGTVASVATSIGDFVGTGSFAGWSPLRLAVHFGVHWGVGVLLAAAAVALFAGGRAAARACLRRWYSSRGASTDASAVERASRLVTPLAFVVLAAYPAFAFADLAFSGGFASKLPFRGAWVALTATSMLAGIHASVLFVHALTQRPKSSTGRRSLAFALLATGVALTVANQHILPNLYPAVHALASLATFGAFAAASVAMASTYAFERADRPRAAAVIGAHAAAATALVVALVAVERSPVLRTALFDPRAAVSQSLMRAVDPITSAVIAPRRQRARASSIAIGPVDALGGPVRPEAHILLVTVDALRADHLGTYGYSRPTSPAIDALAREAVVFEHAYAQAPHSSYSLCSLMASEYLHETLDLGLPLPEATLPRVLRAHGYHSAGFYTRGIFHTDGDRLRAYDERRFDIVHLDHDSHDADERTTAALAEIDRIVAHGEPSSLLWVHYFDAHEPYRATTFGTRDMDRYDSEIARIDRAVGRLVRETRARMTKDVVFVLTADHGEEFRDHGGLYHGSTVYEEQIRVPLVIAVPGVAPRRVSSQVELVDVAPTLLRLVDVEVPSTMRGDDLRGTLVGAGAEPRTAVSSLMSKRAIIEWPYKLVQDTHFRLTELFDLESDPRERTNLAAREPARVAELESDLEAFLDRLGQPARAEADPTLLAMRRARLGDRRAVEPLIALTADDSAPAGTRREAARLLGTLRAPASRATLIEVLRADDPALADEAAIALAALGASHGRRRLVDQVRRPDEDDQRFRAAVALGSLGDARAVPALVAALENGDDVRKQRVAAQVLGELGDVRAIDALIASMTELRLRSSSATALGRIGGARAFEAIIDSISTDRHVTLRDVMARALGEIGNPRALPTLLAMASDEPELMNATRAVIRLGGFHRGLIGGISLWGRERPTARSACEDPSRDDCSLERRSLELPLRVPASLRRGQVQAVLRARVGRGETVTVAWEIGGVALAPVVLDGEAREVRAAVPASALGGPRAVAKLTIEGRAHLVVDHLLLLPLRPVGGV